MYHHPFQTLPYSSLLLLQLQPCLQNGRKHGRISFGPWKILTIPSTPLFGFTNCLEQEYWQSTISRVCGGSFRDINCKNYSLQEFPTLSLRLCYFCYWFCMQVPCASCYKNSGVLLLLILRLLLIMQSYYVFRCYCCTMLRPFTLEAQYYSFILRPM